MSSITEIMVAARRVSNRAEKNNALAEGIMEINRLEEEIIRLRDGLDIIRCGIPSPDIMAEQVLDGEFQPVADGSVSDTPKGSE